MDHRLLLRLQRGERFAPVTGRFLRLREGVLAVRKVRRLVGRGRRPANAELATAERCSLDSCKVVVTTRPDRETKLRLCLTR